MVSTQLDIPALIQNPSKIGEEEILMLREELKNSPWCSTYHVLIAKGYANVDSYLQNKHLRIASTYIGDRAILFNVMHNLQEEVAEKEVIAKEEVAEITEEETVAVAPAEVVEEVPTQEVKAEEILTPITEEVIPERIEAKVELEEVVVETPIAEEVSVVEEIMSEEPVADELLVKEEIQPEEPVIEEAPTLEKSEALPSADKIDFDKIVQYDPIKELEALKVVVTPQEERLSFDTVIYNPEEELSKLIEQKEEVEENGEQDFTSWLNTIGDDKKDATPVSKSPDKVQKLLDQFLATKRKRPIQNRTFYNAQNKAEESEVDSMDVLSETLLELYVKQGHHTKAIAGYQKLSLQNPEKSAYFAARIKELEQLQKE